MYARTVGENARRARFKAFFGELVAANASVDEIDVELRQIGRVDFSKLDYTGAQIENCLKSYPSYQIEVVELSRNLKKDDIKRCVFAPQCV